MFKRRTLNLSEKANLIRDVEIFPNKRKKDIAAKYGIPVTTLCTIYSNRERIIEQCTKDYVNLKMKKIRASSYPDIEEALLDWYIKTYADKEDGYVSGLVLRMKALQLAKAFGHDNFVASNGWVERFKGRHNICLRKPGRKNHVELASEVAEFKISNDSDLLWQNICNPVVNLKEYDEAYNGSDLHASVNVNVYDENENCLPNGNMSLNGQNPILVKAELKSSFLEASDIIRNPLTMDQTLSNHQDNVCSKHIGVESMASDHEAEKALHVLFQYFKNCDSSSERTFQLLEELGNCVSEAKKARKQTKITDFFYTMYD